MTVVGDQMKMWNRDSRIRRSLVDKKYYSLEMESDCPALVSNG